MLTYGPLLNGGRIIGSRRLLSSTVKDPWRLKTTFKWLLPIQTRWRDNDQFAHVNNAVYHEYFDTVINIYLSRHAGVSHLSPDAPQVFMVTNSATFHGSAKYPEVYLAGLAVSKIGSSSIRYKLGLFPFLETDQRVLVDLLSGHFKDEPILDLVADESLVSGESVHVCVDSTTGRPCAIPEKYLSGLLALSQS